MYADLEAVLARGTFDPLGLGEALIRANTLTAGPRTCPLPRRHAYT